MGDGLEATSRRIASFKTASGKEVLFGTLGLSDYASARERMMQLYRREQIRVWTENVSEISDPKLCETMVREAFERAARITDSDLPKMRLRLPKVDSEGKIVRDADGDLVLRDKEVDYFTWWLSETAEGKLTMAWLSMRRVKGQEHFTIGQADEMFTEAMGTSESSLEAAGELIGELTESKLGNSPGPPQNGEGQKTKKQRRRERRAGRSSPAK